MAITFIKEKKRQNILVATFIFIFIITLFIFLQRSIRRETFTFFEQDFLIPPREININFEVFEKIKELQPFVEIEPFEETSLEEESPDAKKIGRENPFMPY